MYSGFAYVYDLFMDNVPYDKWAKYLKKLLKSSKVVPGRERKPLICELGCGTGSMTRRLRDAGFDMIGIDISGDMLDIAREKELPGDESILYLQQDMREFELYGTVAAIVSVCDSMNYITESDDLLKVFRLVRNYLDPGGVFIFDLNTEYYYSKVLGESTICENRDEGSFIWENYYDKNTGINEFDMTIYYDEAAINGEEPTDVYTRCEETHFQRAYRVSEVKKLLKKAGLETVNVYEALTEEKPSSKTERMYFVAKKREDDPLNGYGCRDAQDSVK